MTGEGPEAEKKEYLDEIEILGNVICAAKKSLVVGILTQGKWGKV